MDSKLAQEIAKLKQPLRKVADLEPLIDRLAAARIVMLGEATHGSQEFYSWRRLISEWLISKHGFEFIAVEGDWPPCQSVNRYILEGEGTDARSALTAFHRWPTWMWANTEVIRLVEWLKLHHKPFYGLDVYSLFDSIDAVNRQLAKINPFLARQARYRYACFDPFQRDEKRYAKSLLHFPEGCEDAVVQMLVDLLSSRDGEAIFDAQQNARIIANAEHYYRAMVHGTEDSWNVRDRHMIDTLGVLLDKYGPESKAIVWAHNTHVGDYRATEMLHEGRVNIGGLARERWGDDQVALLGFGTYEGEVTASNAWGGPILKLAVPPAHAESIEAAFHDVSIAHGDPAFFLTFNENCRELAENRGHRAIGVVYSPGHERLVNYVDSSLSNRYDAFLFEDRTHPLEPLILSLARGEIPLSWPSGA